MSSTQTPSTHTPVRNRPGANHRHSKSSSSIAQVPKRHNNRNLTPQHGQSQRSTNPSNANAFSRPLPPKSKGSGDEYTLTHVRSDPTPMANPPLTPPKPSAAAKFTQPYASDSGNLSSNEKKGRKKRPQKRPKDLNTAAAAKAVPYGFQGASDAEPALPPMPHTAKPFATPGKHYAGPTFHHSPAPSALPLPSFFSKSVPSSPNGPSLSTMISSEDSEDSDSSPPSEEAKVDESPLAKLFRADSEERAAGLRHHRRSRRESLLDDNPFKSRSTGNLSMTHGMSLYGDVKKKPELKETSASADMLFTMDALDKKTQVSSDTASQKIKTTGPGADGDLEAAKKRKEKASALKEILLQHAPVSPESLWHGVPLPLSPSPKSRPATQRQENVRSQTPTKHSNYSTSSTPSSTAPKSNNDYSPRPMDRFQQKRDLMAQLQDAAVPKKSSTRSDIQDRAAQKDPKVIEDYLRWALKIDTPSATGVRG